MARICLYLPLVFTTVVLLAATTMAINAMYNIESYGANPDGLSDSTSAFLKAWDEACGSNGPATIVVPEGSFSLGNVTLDGALGKCNNMHGITFNIFGTLVRGAPSKKIDAWIMFSNVKNVFINGGILLGGGPSIWECKWAHPTDYFNECPQALSSLAFYNSENVGITGLTSRDSQMFHITIMGTIKATIRHVKLIAKENAYNTDGIHIQSSSQVTITDSDMETGDDCISIGPDVKTVRIENIDCGPGHGISIGSLGGEGTTTSEVEDIEIRNVRLTETLNGVRVKTWARAASSGFVKNVWVQDVTMDNVWNPILIDQRYCSKPDRQLCFPGEESGIMISNVTFVDIKGTSETAVGVKLDCSRAQPCQDIALNPADVSLTYNGAPAKASCANVQCPIGFPRF